MHLQLVENIKHLVIDFPAQETNVFFAQGQGKLLWEISIHKNPNLILFQSLLDLCH